MDRTVPADKTATPTPTGAPVPEAPGLLGGVPRQRAGGGGSCGTVDPGGGEPTAVEKPRPRPRLRTPRPWRLLPTPTGTPFTFGYAIVLCVTSLISAYADPALVHALLQGSSTDVAHLVRTPELVLVGSALWLAGGVASPFAIGFVLVLTALERRIGGLRTAGVFLLGHVLATLATEVPVGLAVLAGQLPGSSLHRLDYGVSFGVAAGTGALAGLLPPWLRVPLLAGFGGMLLQDLLALSDPMTDWGHLIALAIGVATWPVVRRWQMRGPRSPGPVRG
ncbi:rhomboid-like protein [Streptomyces coeruleorubidus]|uniref:rhomboid-like protein n=1 Tax=Streptomyces coeruleorubidus TaxID=116188 RepID=UPI003795437E